MLPLCCPLVLVLFWYNNANIAPPLPLSSDPVVVTVYTACWEMENVQRVLCGRPWHLPHTTTWTTW